jgi:sarcosine oxidase subunit beta
VENYQVLELHGHLLHPDRLPVGDALHIRALQSLYAGPERYARGIALRRGRRAGLLIGARSAAAPGGRGWFAGWYTAAIVNPRGNRPVSPPPAVRYAAQPPATADLVVIGGGVIGAATAYFAARAGLSVVLLEKRAALCTLTTPASTGAFRLQFDNAEETDLVRESVQLFHHFDEVTGLDGFDLGLRVQGYLFCVTSEPFAQKQRGWVAAMASWGVDDVELLNGDEARYRFPHLGPNVIQARFRAGDGWLDPKRLTLGYARASGATICLDTPATGLERSGDRVVGVVTPRRTIRCGEVVNAAGPFSAQVAAWAGLPIEIRPTTRVKLVLPEVLEVPPDAPMTIDEETAAHWRPGLRGAYGLWTEPGSPPEEPRETPSAPQEWALNLLNPASEHSLARICPFWEQVWERGSAYWLPHPGQYDYTPDHKPLLGPTAVPGFHLNTGYSGHGIMAGSAASRLVVDLLLGRARQEDNPFRYDRRLDQRPLDIL